MKTKFFKKGVHPYDAKALSKDVEIKSISATGEMVYPLVQSIGAPAKACVEVGERVLKGQKIAEAGGFVSAPIYSSVSGTVKAIQKRLVTNGSMVESIIIENDNLDETTESFGKQRDVDNLTAEEIVDIVKEAGIVGLGGAGFPTGVKLSPKNPNDIDTVIINGAECEPYLNSDYRLMLEKGDEIVKGIKAVLKLFPNAKAVIGIEDNKPDAIKQLTAKTEQEDRISVQPLKTKYPQGGERQLIYTITGRKLNSKMLPADKGCIVVNTASCYAIYEAVYLSMPLIHKIMTISGEAVLSPCNLNVPLGISHSAVLEAAGGAKDNVVKMISGGPMTGTAMSSLDVPVVKTSASILAFSEDDVAALSQSSCIHCGKCVGACPELLVPQMLAKTVKSNDYVKFDDLGGMECIECGCCSYVCPAKIPLTQMFKLGKVKVRENRAKV
ncbi:MAG: electron transport complex subunit RsxC [Clostridium sp.]|nr:electron transport complex subunit RsxC [Clostridium sp.]